MKLLKASFLTVFTVGSIAVSAQNYNYRYENDIESNVVQPLGKSIVQLDGNCGVATVNSVRDTDGYYDMQITFLKEDGTFWKSFTVGHPGRNEYCHAICKSSEYSDQFILVGKSSNDQFLVVKIDFDGNVIWSKEVIYPADHAEAITVFPVNSTAFPEGYIITGNTNGVSGANAVAAVKLDEDGVMDWSARYSMGTKILMTDAIGAKNYADRIFTIVGNEQSNGIFYMNVYADNGNIFYYPGAKYSLPSQVSLYNAHLTEINDNGDRHHILTFGRNAMMPNSVGVYAMRLEGYSDFSPIWAKHYEQPGQHGYINSDITTLSSNSASLVGGVSTLVSSWPSLVQEINPYVLNIDYDGFLNTANDYNVGGYEFTGAIIESCNSGYEVFNAYPLEAGVQWDLRVIKKDNPSSVGCNTNISWTEVVEEVEENPLNMVAQFSGVVVDHYVPSSPVQALKYDCNGALVLMPVNTGGTILENQQTIAGEIEEISDNRPWFYPNPASHQLNIFAEETSLIQLYDMAGRLVISKEVTGTVTVSIADLKPGVYTISKHVRNGIVDQHKLVIQ